MSLWRQPNGKLTLLGQVLHDYATGPDGQTYAIGRVLGALLFAIASPAPPIAALIGVINKPASVADWNGFFTGAAAYYAALAAAVTGLVWGTNPTEPKAPPGG